MPTTEGMCACLKNKWVFLIFEVVKEFKNWYNVRFFLSLIIVQS